MISVLWIKNPRTGKFEYARRGKSTHYLMVRNTGVPDYDAVPRGWFEIEPHGVCVCEYVTVPHYAGADAWNEYVRCKPRFQTRALKFSCFGKLPGPEYWARTITRATVCPPHHNPRHAGNRPGSRASEL